MRFGEIFVILDTNTYLSSSIENENFTDIKCVRAF